MPSTDPGPVRLALVGEAPGADESSSGHPFSGPSGWMLDQWLSSAGLSRAQVFVGNVAQVRPGPDSNDFHLFEWNGEAIQAGVAALQRDLAAFRPHCVLAMGNAALHLFRHGNVAPLKSQKKRLFQWQSHVGTWRGSLFLGPSDFDAFKARELRFAEGERYQNINFQPRVCRESDAAAVTGDALRARSHNASLVGTTHTEPPRVTGERPNALVSAPYSEGTFFSGVEKLATSAPQGGTPAVTLGNETARNPGDTSVKQGPPSNAGSNPAAATFFKCLSTYHPAATFRDPSFTYPLVSDLRRAAQEARTPVLTLPPRNIRWGLSLTELESAIEAIRAARTPVGFDIEGGLGGLQCCSFATSPSDAIVIDLMALGSDGPATYRLLASVLEDPLVPKVCWNAAYERAILRAVASINLAGYEDGMLAWWERFSELPKGLDFVASLLTREPYWAEGIGWDAKTGAPKVTGPRFWTYNCLAQSNLVVTRDGHKSIGGLVRGKKSVEVLSLNEATGLVEWKPITKFYRREDPSVTFLRITIAGNGSGNSVKPIICTPEHKVLTVADGWLPASELVIGDQLWVEEREWGFDKRGALLGTILGDTHIARTSNPAKAYATCGQVIESLPRLKASLFGGTVTMAHRVSGYSRQNRPVWTWYMPACRQLEHLRQALSGPITHRLLDQLNDQGLALWFMDDGCKQVRHGKRGKADSAIFCLQGFPPSERQTIAEWFNQRFGHGCLTTHGSFVLGAGASERLCARIGAYVLPEYRYKLPGPAPEWNPLNAHLSDSGRPIWDTITNIQPFVPPKGKRGYKMRYCIDVADNHNFFTSSGLVHNCIDSCVTLEIWQHPTIRAVVESRQPVPFEIL